VTPARQPGHDEALAALDAHMQAIADTKTAIADLQTRLADLEAGTVQKVADARTASVTWPEIGAVTGQRPQHAQRKWSKLLVETVTRTATPKKPTASK